MQTLATVLFQLNLFDVHSFSHYLAFLFSSKEAVCQHAIYSNWPTLLSDLVSSLKREIIILNSDWQDVTKHQSMVFFLKLNLIQLITMHETCISD